MDVNDICAVLRAISVHEGYAGQQVRGYVIAPEVMWFEFMPVGVDVIPNEVST